MKKNRASVLQGEKTSKKYSDGNYPLIMGIHPLPNSSWKP